MPDHHPTTQPSGFDSTDKRNKITMKYSEACNMKALADQSISTLERRIMEGMITAASRKQLIATYVNFPCNVLRQ